MKNHTCSKDLYIKFLKVTSCRYSAVSLSEVSPVELSHDAVSRWLSDTKCQPKDIWDKTADYVLNTLGVVVVDETVISKNRSNKIEIARWLYSGSEHDVVKGIGVLNFFWSGISNNDCTNSINNSDGGDGGDTSDKNCDMYTTPFDYRIYEPKEDGKTKNDHFREMLVLGKKRGINPEAVVADTWFSSLDNLKCVRDLGWKWVMGLKKNRTVNRKGILENLDISENGLKVHLKGYGWIFVFKFASKNGRIDYVGTSIENPTTEEIKKFVGMRWDIEVFHRELKQTCGLGKCQAHTSRSQRNHIGLAILCWIELAKQRAFTNLSFYQQSWEILKPAISQRLKYEFNST